ncbi:probable receptor-like protein kinase At5g20050 [Pyrus communis]|uniref:probable receptor-like protein kinase At5g20050 n=1 Tax=Pyrus communis TaxID=23211 RepID=UPI0035C25E85
MEDRKAKIVAASSIITLVVFIIVARISLKLSPTFFLICGAGVAVILAVFVWLVIRHQYNFRRRLLESKHASEGRELRVEYSFLRKVAGVPTKFRYKELEDATDHFETLVGKGASASVYKGILSDGTQVAVKKLDVEERGEREFKSEVAAIASLQHINLVRLLGYCCVPAGPRFLVYDFIPNGSLDLWIFSQKGRSIRCGGCLPWDSRYRVAVDVAKALSYLHHDCRSRILHLDVKPENILLDENYRAIVADFGLSKLMGKDESRVMTTIRGTRGYLAPEWLLEHGISEKTDVYSYGMVLLEMIGGRRNVSFIEMGEANDKSHRKREFFPKIVIEKMRDGKLMEVVDQRLIESGGMDEKEVKRLVHIALWCIQERARLRPTMSHVVEMLEGRTPVEEPPDTQMVVVDFSAMDEEAANGNRRPKIGGAALAAKMGSNDASASTWSYGDAMSMITPR